MAKDDVARDSGPPQFLLLATLSACLSLVTLILFVLPGAVHAPHPDLLDWVNEIPGLWPAAEIRDRVVHGGFALVALGAVAFAVMPRLRFPSRRPSLPIVSVVWVVASVLLFVNIAVHDHRLGNVTAFVGFDLAEIALVIVGLAVWLVWPRQRQIDRRLRYVGIVSGTLLALWRLLTIVQFESGVLDQSHASYVTNELLAVSAGSRPLLDFVSMYTSGLGYMFALWDPLLPGESVTSMIWFISGLNVAIVGSVVLGARWAWKSWSATVWPVLMTVAGLSFVARGPSQAIPYQLSDYWPAVPIRMIGLAVVVVGTVVLRAIPRRWVGELLAGCLLAAAIIMNVESGIAASVGLAMVVVLSVPIDRRLSLSALLLAGPMAIVLGLLLIAQAGSATCDVFCLVESVRLFGSMGYYSVDMPVLGAHLLLFTGFVVAGVAAARRLRPNHAEPDRVALLTIGVSFFGLVLGSHFVGRSYMTVLVPLFPPFALAASGLRTLVDRDRVGPWLDRLMMAPVMFVALLPMAFLADQSSPDNMLERLSGDLPGFQHSLGVDIPGLEEAIVDTVTHYGITRNEIGIVSQIAMPLAIEHGVRPAIAYNSPLSIVTRQQEHRQCDFIWESGLEVVLFHPQGRHTNFEPSLFCGSFVFDRVVEPGLVTFIRVKMDEELLWSIDQATAAGLFGTASEIKVAFVVDPRQWTGHGGLQPTQFAEDPAVTVSAGIPTDYSLCGEGRLCDAVGRPIELLVGVDQGEAWVIGRFAVTQAPEAGGDVHVSLDGAVVAGPLQHLPDCGGEIVEAGSEFVVVRCLGGTGPANEMVAWMEGCGLGSMSRFCPVDPELVSMAVAAAEMGYFELSAGGSLVVDHLAFWSHRGGSLLEELVAPFDVVVTERIDDGANACGIAAVCNADGRQVFALAVVERGAGRILVWYPVAAPGDGFDQALSMVNTTLMFGEVDVVPGCDIGGDDGSGVDSAAVWTMRSCAPVVPTLFSTFREWVAEGCAGRTGWWLCPTK